MVFIIGIHEVGKSVEAMIARETVPVRPGRARPRFMKNTRTYICFSYMVA